MQLRLLSPGHGADCFLGGAFGSLIRTLVLDLEDLTTSLAVQGHLDPTLFGGVLQPAEQRAEDEEAQQSWIGRMDATVLGTQVHSQSDPCSAAGMS